ncbi:hypothetical protein EDC01DRAFT_15816 [Geopyxis carbonaria]|nr:hypothetical protein EDC01DRAFT_15816 [Geopyxis carbonaria]
MKPPLQIPVVSPVSSYSILLLFSFGANKTHADLNAFRHKHFESGHLNSCDDENSSSCIINTYPHELGYYDDGVKRNLTDEQIKIFRFSEVQRLLMKRHEIAERTKRQTDNLPLEDEFEARDDTTIQPTTLEETRKFRLEAALWASHQDWNKTSKNPDQSSSKNFSWPKIEHS